MTLTAMYILGLAAACLDNRQQLPIHPDSPFNIPNCTANPCAGSLDFDTFHPFPRVYIPMPRTASQDKERFRPPPRSLAKPCRSRRAAECSPQIVLKPSAMTPRLGMLLEELQSLAKPRLHKEHPVPTRVPAVRTAAVMLCTTYKACRGARPNPRPYPSRCCCRP